MALPLGMQAQGTSVISVCNRNITAELQGYTYTQGDQISWSYNEYLWFSEWKLQDGKVVGQFYVPESVADQNVPIWIDAVIVPANTGRPFYYYSATDTIYYPVDVRFRCFNAGQNWILEVDPGAVEAIESSNSTIHFNYDDMAVIDTDSISYVACEGSMPPVDLPFDLNLVWTTSGEGECAQVTEGFRDDGGYWPENMLLNKSNTHPSAPQRAAAGDTQVRVYDLQGAIVYDAMVDGSSFKLQSTPLANGIYVMETTQADGTVKSEKITLNK